MTFENVEQILNAIKLNSKDTRIYLEITSLISAIIIVISCI